jgi:hypothetical protein
MSNQEYDMSGKLNELVKMHGEMLGTLAYVRSLGLLGSNVKYVGELPGYMTAQSGIWLKVPRAAASMRIDKLMETDRAVRDICKMTRKFIEQP